MHAATQILFIRLLSNFKKAGDMILAAALAVNKNRA
jgi:hypothetical protein